jgi:hypothetical protein
LFADLQFDRIGTKLIRKKRFISSRAGKLNIRRRAHGDDVTKEREMDIVTDGKHCMSDGSWQELSVHFDHDVSLVPCHCLNSDWDLAMRHFEHGMQTARNGIKS